MSKESYLRGFVKAAKENGVDPVNLAGAVSKKSTPVSEFATAQLTNLLIPGSGVLNAPGAILGLADDQDNSQKPLWLGFVPGYAGYARGNRLKTQVLRELEQIKKDKKHEGARPVAHAVSEFIGPHTSMLSSVLLGSLVGGAGTAAWTDDKDKAMAGGVAGAIAGGGYAAMKELVAAIKAAIHRRRTKEEQIESDKRSLLRKYLIPGAASYDYYKRMGRTQGERDEDSDNGKKKEDK